MNSVRNVEEDQDPFVWLRDASAADIEAVFQSAIYEECVLDPLGAYVPSIDDAFFPRPWFDDPIHKLARLVLLHGRSS